MNLGKTSSILGVRIFIADDLTLNSKLTYLLAVVKSSKIITGKSV